jgi:hypothetical protein
VTKGDAFLQQAKSDLRLFELLIQRSDVEPCHTLHYLQLATEKFAMAILFAQNGAVKRTHIAISTVSPMLMRRFVADKMGYKEKRQAFYALVHCCTEIFCEIERLCPAIAYSSSAGEDMPNVEYPWVLRMAGAKAWIAPCDHKFADIRYKSNSKQMLHLLNGLCDRFHEIF